LRVQVQHALHEVPVREMTSSRGESEAVWTCCSVETLKTEAEGGVKTGIYCKNVNIIILILINYHYEMSKIIQLNVTSLMHVDTVSY